MLELVIGLGIAAGGILATNILWFVLLHSANARGDRGDAQGTILATKITSQAAELDHALEVNRILDENQAGLLKELGDLKTSTKTTEAELASVKASRDDLVRSLADHPGALPPLVHGALERVRAQMSAVAAPATPGDPHGGEARAVHDPDALEPPE